MNSFTNPECSHLQVDTPLILCSQKPYLARAQSRVDMQFYSLFPWLLCSRKTCLTSLGLFIYLAPIVETLDSAFHRINLSPVDNSIGFPNAYPVDGDLSNFWTTGADVSFLRKLVSGNNVHIRINE